MGERAWRLREGVAFQEDDGLLVDFDSGRVLELNASARLMVKQMEHGMEATVRAVRERYPNEDPDRIALDLQDLVARLRESGFLETGNQGDVMGGVD